jgi:hypothetical protein
MITKPPLVTPRNPLHEHTVKETVSSSVTWAASKCHFKCQFSDNEQTEQLVHFSPTLINTKCLAPCWQPIALQQKAL